MKLELSWSEEKEVQGGDEELSLMFLNPSLIKRPFRPISPPPPPPISSRILCMCFA